MSVVDRSEDGGKPDMREAHMREEFRRYYRHFEGKVYLPLFAVKNGKDYEVLDYYQHLLSHVDMAQFAYDSVDWNMAEALTKAKDSFFRLNLDQEFLERVDEQESLILETDEQVLSWLVASLPFEHFSHKQLRAVVGQVREHLYESNAGINGRLGLVKFIVREKLVGLIQRETDRQTQSAFEHLFVNKRLCFALECVEARIEIPPVVELRATRRLVHDDGEQVQQSLFDYVPDAFNDYEKAVALYLDTRPQVLWWYRNLIGPEQFYIQGYKRHKIYPDFVVQEGTQEENGKKPIASVLVLESKGKHLKGSEDTNYKRSMAEYFGKVGHEVPWQKLAEDFRDHRFRVQVLDEGEYQDRDWRHELKKLLAEPVVLQTSE